MPRASWGARALAFGLLVALPSVNGCQCLAHAPPGYTGKMTVAGEVHDYGADYGMGHCAPHDSRRPPRCDGLAFPTWCELPWCYVEPSTCNGSAIEPSLVNPGLYYSYQACGADEAASKHFARDFESFAGRIRLCSVFSQTDASLVEVHSGPPTGASTPCGNSATHLQVQAMVEAINALNDGRGFAVEGGFPLSPRYVRFDYRYTIYPYGQWEAVGRNLSRNVFTNSCDVVVGMAQGCPDVEIALQGLVANETGRIFITGRGPRRVRTMFGLNQPYFFSVHLNSDNYSEPALLQWWLAGVRSAFVIYEDYGNYFFTDLGRSTVAAARARRYSVQHRVLTRADGTAFDPRVLNESLDAAIAAKPDLLVAIMRQPEWIAANARLSARRPGTATSQHSETHAFKAIWFQGASWSGDCVGEGAACAHVVGASQFDPIAEALDAFPDSLLGGRTYRWLRYESGLMATASESFVDFPDAAVIPSLLAQAFQQVFRFRPLTENSRPLGDELNYELLRYFLASGTKVGNTFYGPMSFDAFGQNNGREPSTMQVTAPSNGTAGGLPLTIFPTSRAVKAFVHPSPASSECPSSAYEIAFGSACLLCAPDVCVLEGPRYALIFSVSGTALFILLIIVAVLVFVYYSSFRQWMQLREPLRLVEDGSVPRPLLPRGKRFHLFLSHCWFSGQDQCGVIKRRLRLLLPLCQTFLDVDDLESTGQLEKHVAESAAVLLFLSHCYFESYNCRREVLAALEHSIPLILVHELQRGKSTPLSELRASCILHCGEHAVSAAFLWRQGIATELSSTGDDAGALALPLLRQHADGIVRRRREDEVVVDSTSLRELVMAAMQEMFISELGGHAGDNPTLRIAEHGPALLHDKLGFTSLGRARADMKDVATALLTSRPSYLQANPRPGPACDCASLAEVHDGAGDTLTIDVVMEACVELRLFEACAAEMGQWIERRLFTMAPSVRTGFPQPRPVIPWVRSERLQLESFKQICEAIIHACNPVLPDRKVAKRAEAVKPPYSDPCGTGAVSSAGGVCGTTSSGHRAEARLGGSHWRSDNMSQHDDQPLQPDVSGPTLPVRTIMPWTAARGVARFAQTATQGDKDVGDVPYTKHCVGGHHVMPGESSGTLVSSKRSHTTAPPVMRLGELVHADGELAHLGGAFIADLTFGARKPVVVFSIANAGVIELVAQLEALYAGAVAFQSTALAAGGTHSIGDETPRPIASSPRSPDAGVVPKSFAEPVLLSPGSTAEHMQPSRFRRARAHFKRAGLIGSYRFRTSSSLARMIISRRPDEASTEEAEMNNVAGRASRQVVPDFFLLLLNRAGLVRGNTELRDFVSAALDLGLRPIVLHDLRPSEVNETGSFTDFSAHMDLWQLQLGGRSRAIFQRIALPVHGGDAHFAASAVLIAEAMGAKVTPLPFSKVAALRKQQMANKKAEKVHVLVPKFDGRLVSNFV